MKKEDLENLTNNINTKLGEENAGLIADDLAKLITENDATNTILQNKDNEITKLKQTNENLLKVNANLFQQVGVEDNIVKNKNNETNEKKFSLKDAFDDKGNFK